MQLLNLWAQTLAEYQPTTVPKAQVDLLQTACLSTAVAADSGTHNGTAYMQLAAIEPLCHFLVASKDMVDTHQKVLAQLAQLVEGLSEATAASTRTAACDPVRVTEALNSLSRVLASKAVPVEWKTQISTTFRRVLLAALCMPGGLQLPQALLQGLRQALLPSQADVSRHALQLPLTSDDAYSLLRELTESVDKQASQDAYVPPALACMNLLVQQHSSSTPLNQQLAESALAQSSRYLRKAQRMLSPANNTTDGTAAASACLSTLDSEHFHAAVAAATALASSVVAQLLVIQTSNGQRKGRQSSNSAAPREWDIGAAVVKVAELVLSLAEATVASAWQAADPEQVLPVTLAMLSNATPLMVAVAQASSTHFQEFVARVRTLMLSAAKLSESCSSMSRPEPPGAAGERDCWRAVLNGIPLAQGSYAQRVTATAAHLLCELLLTGFSSGGAAALKAGVLPLADSGSLGAAGSSPAEQQAVLTVAARVCIRAGGEGDLIRLGLPLLLDALAHDSSKVQACAAHMLAAVAAASASSDGQWVVEQAVEALATQLRKPSLGRRDVAADNESPDQPADFAAALALLASGLQTAPEAIRRNLRTRLLSLFADVAQAGEPGSAATVQALGALLPALAEACDGLNAQPMSMLDSKADTSREAALALQDDDANLVKLFRLLWLYAACNGLTAFLMPTQSTAGNTADGMAGQQAAAWRTALGRLAAASPPLAVGGRAAQEKLEAELGDRLKRLGRRGSAYELVSRLSGLLGSQPHALPRIPNAAAAAHFLTVATVNVCRASAAPLAQFQQVAPLAPLFARMAVAPATEAQVLQCIARRAFDAYCDRMRTVVPAAQVQEAECMRKTQTALVCVLTAHLQPQAGQQQVAGLADELLGRLLERLPFLLWRAEVLDLLLTALARADAGRSSEAGASPVGHHRGPASLLWRALPAAASGAHKVVTCSLPRHTQEAAGQEIAIWKWVKEVVARGAAHAPERTQALLAEQLRSDDTPAGAAALRRSGDLLALAAAPGRHAQAASDGAAAELRALRRKAQYSGAVRSLVMGDQGQEASGMAARGVMQQLARQLDSWHGCGPPTPRLVDTYMQAAAMAVHAPAGSDAQALLRLMARAPGVCFHPDMLRHATLAWHWLLAAAPEVTVALLAEVSQAWQSTVDRRVGLFGQSGNAAAASQSVDQPATCASAAAEAAMQRTQHDWDAQASAIRAHSIWLDFLCECWQAAQGGGLPDQQAVNALLAALLQRSLADPDMLTHHPAAAGMLFRMLALALRVVSNAPARAGPNSRAQSSSLLQERVLRAALLWFAAPPAWYGRWAPGEARREAAAVREFAALLQAAPAWPLLPGQADAGPVGPGAPQQWRHPVWAAAQASNLQRLELLQVLLADEGERLATWGDPLLAGSAGSGAWAARAPAWPALAAVAWDTSPALALALRRRFPAAPGLDQQLAALVAAHAHEPSLQALPDGAALLALSAARAADAPQLRELASWAPAPMLDALALVAGAAGRHPAVRSYALRSLQSCPPEQVAFLLPQLVQLLRGDADGLLRAFLLAAASRSLLFAHRLVCTLKSEGTPPPEARDPPVKRAGWAPPADTGLWQVADAVCEQVWQCLPAESAEHLRTELAFFDQVTAVSGQLFPVPKDERKAAAVKLLHGMTVPRNDLYLPTNPHSRVRALLPETGTPMQSAAKVPLLVAFQVEEDVEGECQERVQACIFKVGDDCRQDVLALQVIGLLKEALGRAGLPLYLAPYGVLPTAYECGIIEVVPEAKSRSALGETADGGLYEIFCREFGAPGSPRFESARENFIASSAGYAIASYLLQSKDRHNGNILVDSAGHLVHIDFGFILEISPGGNLGFESAAFKLSHEMTQLLDPGGMRNSSSFREFEALCCRGFLAARGVAEGIIAAVALMAQSGLPCFGRGQPVANLRRRFRLDLSDRQAAAFMHQVVLDAYDKWTTGFYDYVQYLQNAIPK